jgi:hypothetical protein
MGLFDRCIVGRLRLSGDAKCRVAPKTFGNLTCLTMDLGFCLYGQKTYDGRLLKFGRVPMSECPNVRRRWVDVEMLDLVW